MTEYILWGIIIVGLILVLATDTDIPGDQTGGE